MELIAGSEEDQDWICDLCDLHNIHNLSRPLKVQAWRCSQDVRLTKQNIGCEFDICSLCVMARRCITANSETGKGGFQKLLSGFFPLRGGGYPPFPLRVFGQDDFPLRGEGVPPNSVKEKIR